VVDAGAPPGQEEEMMTALGYWGAPGQEEKTTAALGAAQKMGRVPPTALEAGAPLERGKQMMATPVALPGGGCSGPNSGRSWGVMTRRWQPL
jgi:hypothetical protein